jgi:hypothetical protein
MIASAESLLKGIIDYAGLFPPAKLNMSEAVRNYCKYKSGPEAWIVDKFVCPITRLSEMESCLGRMQFEKSIPVCLIGRGGETAQEFLQNTIADLAVVRRSATRTDVGALEVRIPPAAMNAKAIGHLAVELKRRRGELDVFLEPPLTDDWRSDITMVIETIAITQATGAKIRLGGASADAFPPIEVVSHFIFECARNRIDLKATAGLHHAVRHFDNTMNCHVHGFLNVFVAAMLAYSQQCQRSQIDLVLKQDDPRAFVFDKDGLSCLSPKVTNVQIQEARRYARSFGSCSVAEPVADLAAMGQPLEANFA